ncbi:DsbA family protein [Pectobacterium aroidearum]|uniref:DsbA family protein n=1 Tax=Pectobacterium aroidearum TaxID=1201031 RepID=UPI0032EEBD26
MTTTLHYIHDPLCGWCYGAAPLIKAAREVLPVHAHGGGMMAGSKRQKVTPQLREFVKQHDTHIAKISGQPFGKSYVDGLLCDSSAVLDSEPPIAAILAAEQLTGRGLDMLAALQTAHYVEGKRIADRAPLIELATQLGLGVDAFATALEAQRGASVQTHIRQTRELMARVGARGFPTLVLEHGEGLTRVDLSPFMGRPVVFRDWLRLQSNQADTASDASPLACDIDGCTI